ncbi:MAG: S49 family peptidase [Myxococcota bacterium]|nr:S49 family peptidase [Myxococcota bacterium]
MISGFWTILCVMQMASPGLEWRSRTFGADEDVQGIYHDSAAISDVSSFQLMLEKGLHLQGKPNNFGRISLGFPLGGLKLQSAYQWNQVAGDWWLGGLGFNLGAASFLGVSYSGDQRTESRYWRFGFHTEPTRWLRTSLGLGLPRAKGVGPTYSLGLSTRFPFEGNLVRASVDTYLEGRDGVRWHNAKFDSLGVGVGISVASGIELGLHYRYFNSDEQYLGSLLSIQWNAGSAGLHTGLGMDFSRPNKEAEDGRLIAQIGLKVSPSSGLEIARRRIRIPLYGNLRFGDGSWFSQGPETSNLAWLLGRLEERQDIEEVVFDIRKLTVTLADVQEIRRAIRSLKKAGKRVVAELTMANEYTYLVASAADEVVLDPMGILRIDGFVIRRRYFGDALAKLGIKVDVVSIGKYKTAPDLLTRSTPRDEDVEMRKRLLDGAHQYLVETLHGDRNISFADINMLINRGHCDATCAIEYGLVDKIKGNFTEPELPFKDLVKLVEERSNSEWGAETIVPVITVGGTILSSGEFHPLVGKIASADRIVPQLEWAARSSRVAGVVLRLESPGGDVYASERIWRAARMVANRKPLVVSMGSMAASGAYYIASAADSIYANADSVTGSIGIFGMFPDVSGLWEKLGVGSHAELSAPLADWDSMDVPLEEGGAKEIRRVLHHYYDFFVKRIMDGRKLSKRDTYKIATGEVLTGLAAKEKRLVDRIGGLQDAYKEVLMRAKLESKYARLVFPESSVSIVDRILSWGALGKSQSYMKEFMKDWNVIMRSYLAITPNYYEVQE